MTMTKVLRDLGHEKVTVHGFRSSFTDWAAEKTKTPKGSSTRRLPTSWLIVSRRLIGAPISLNGDGG